MSTNSLTPARARPSMKPTALAAPRERSRHRPESAAGINIYYRSPIFGPFPIGARHVGSEEPVPRAERPARGAYALPGGAARRRAAPHSQNRGASLRRLGAGPFLRAPP